MGKSVFGDIKVLNLSIVIHSGCTWNKFSTIVQEEGNLIKVLERKTNKDCESLCDENIHVGCRSFGYCPAFGGCYLYDQTLYGIERLTSRTDCYTNYRTCEGNLNTLDPNLF